MHYKYSLSCLYLNVLCCPKITDYAGGKAVHSIPYHIVWVALLTGRCALVTRSRRVARVSRET